MNPVAWPSIPPLDTPRSCTLDPALYALDWLVRWTVPVQFPDRTVTDTPVLEVLRDALRDPQSYGLSAEQAQAAAERFLGQATPILETEGGQRAWLERELQR
ncbi:hypothetical protein [Deinococcus radiophilus]|uniref:Uncharacterized protein n=1 Tax=Deinococcus radiophilus TaxID=32062 RepID=A0A431VYH0_9DEIO|nr:hypothetical protein [Deinococcus radiophilus]RTR28327.1 hypothetical protein EJ104_05305 [Deinococcus radiophilus]UFA51193.1 hypothetical protein LMT64_04660 [Deinococcus radiophilus]